MHKKKTWNNPQYRPDFASYERLKAAWVKAFPKATPAQYQDAMRVIAQRCGI